MDKVCKKYNAVRPRVIVGVPSGITEVEERAVEDIIPNSEYIMSGNKIMVRTLDLNKDFKFIAQSLNKIASDLINS